MIYFSYWSINKWINYSDNSYLFYFILSFFTLLSLILYSKKFINKYSIIISKIMGIILLLISIKVIV